MNDGAKVHFIELIRIMSLYPLSNPLFVTASAVATTHLLGGLLLRPTLALCVSDSLSGLGTHLAAFAARGSNYRPHGSITGQQRTGLFELSNFGVNRSENIF